MENTLFKCAITFVAAVLTDAAVAAPLSCTMKRDLVTVSAQLRDIGVPQKDVRTKLTEPGELTREEVDAILKVAYGSMRTVPREKIGNAIYNLCIQAQRR